jgi:hypothetical protein
MDPEFPGEATHVSVRRYIAHLADGVVFLLVFVLLVIPAGILSDVLLAIVVVLLLTVGQVAFYVLAHGRSGRSPGKRLVGLRVVDAHGPPARHRRARQTLDSPAPRVLLRAGLDLDDGIGLPPAVRRPLGQDLRRRLRDLSPPAAA